MAVYRGKSSMYEYITAGAVTGGVYKFNMGLRGIAAGALVGGALGTIAGGLSLAILVSTGMTMEEVRYWQYKWRSSRDDAIQDTFRETFKNDSDRNDPLLVLHDDKLGSTALDIKKIIADEVAEINLQIKEESQKKKESKEK
jgi:complex I assembly factor TIMMDC1